MKRILAAALLLTILMFSLPAIPQDGTPEPAVSAAPAKKAARLDKDAKRSIVLLTGEETQEISVRDYLIGVVAAEMPASFEEEALKAQAVAARSYLQRALEKGSRHENADICGDSDCCQAYKSEKELREAWGDKYEGYIKKIEKAVSDTDGEYLSFEGEPAMAAFHSSSSGTTENSGELWNGLPYLVSVDTPETEKDVPNFISTLELREIDFRDTILYAKPEADMTGDADNWVGELTRDEAGRIGSIVIGGESFSGSELRSLFSLRSTDFSLAHEGGIFTFTVKGYGHGVGMSQYGANVMAKNGADYREILSHYYPGTSLS